MALFAISFLYGIRFGTARTVIGEFSESIVVVEANDLDDARAKGLSLARAEEVAYKNDAGENVEWRLEFELAIVELAQEKLDAGQEVFFRSLDVAQGQALSKGAAQIEHS